MSSYITYEQPLNERVRTFLRIEHLFNQEDYYARNNGMWDSRQCVATLLEIADLLGRSDIKSELIKELERHAATLSALERNPGVDHRRLQEILEDISNYLNQLRDKSCQPGQALRKDELVMSIKQRNTISGGTCNFDLPSYHYWLHKPDNERFKHLSVWQDDLLVIKRSVKLSLHMIRNSTNPSSEIAENGFFQRPIEPNLSCQLIRVILPVDSEFFPEISGGKHRFTIRFMEQNDTSVRPIQTDSNVEFELHCCIL